MLQLLSKVNATIYSFCRKKPLAPIGDFFDNPANHLPIIENPSPYISSLKKSASRFKKIIIWGLRTEMHTHRYIHLAFYNTLKECDINVLWVDNIDKYNDLITRDSIVFCVGICSNNLKIKNNVYYVAHNVEISDDISDNKNILKLQVYTNQCKQQGVFLQDKTTIYNDASKILYQAWGTDVAPYRFANPRAGGEEKIIYWVGSIWNEYNQGNIDIISQARNIFERYGIKFIHRQPVSAKKAIKLIQNSFIAPAIAGKWQVDNDYLPCRMFKNISYGMLGMSNVYAFTNIYGKNFIHFTSIDEMLIAYFALDKKNIIDMIRYQQDITKKDHTYFTKLKNIFEVI